MLSSFSLLQILLCAPALAAPVLKRAAPSFVFDGDAPFSVDDETLADSLTCPNGLPTQSSPPVLLVHGTAVTGDATWGQGYVPALLSNGYTGCYVTLPGRAMGDMQISSEYIAYNIHYLSQLSGGLQPAIIAHSQGNPDTQWALEFWPSTRSVARALISLSPDFHGISLFDSPLSGACEGNSLCQAALWQQSSGSNYYNALHSGDFQALVPTTTIWTQFDGVVMPAEENAQLPNANVLKLQDLCPLRPASHITITVDAAAYSIALDALNNGGIADMGRVRRNSWTSCFRISAKGMQVTIPTQLQEAFDVVVKGFLTGPGRTATEPPIKAYAIPSN